MTVAIAAVVAVVVVSVAMAVGAMLWITVLPGIYVAAHEDRAYKSQSAPITASNEG